MAEKKSTGASGAKGKGKTASGSKKPAASKPKTPGTAAKPKKAEVAAAPEAKKHEQTVTRPETTVVKEREKTTAAPPTNKGKKGLGTAIATIVGIVLVGLILLAAIVYLNLSAFSKAAVERVASDALGVPVTIGEMVVNLDEMSITVSGLLVANPPGFTSPNAIEVANMAIFAENLSPEKMVFNEIQVGEASVYLDVTETSTNLSVLRDNIEARQAARGDAAAPAAEPEANAQASQTKIVVKSLTVSGARLVPSATMVEAGALEPVELPEFSGSIGQESGGVTPEEAIAAVGNIVLKAASRTAVQSGLVQGTLEKKLDEASEKLGIDDQTVDSIKDSIRGLFGGGN